MAIKELPELKTNIINLKEIGDKFEGWITGKHEGKYGLLFDGISENGEGVSIQSNPDLIGRMTFYTFGQHITIKVADREKTAKGSEFKRFKVTVDDDTSASWDSVKHHYIDLINNKKVSDNPDKSDTKEMPF